AGSGNQQGLPEVLLQFDELRYQQDLSLYHGTAPADDSRFAWAILGKYQASAHLDLGRYYQRTGQHPLAFREFKKALVLEPGNARVHFNLGLFYFDRREHLKAHREFQKALELDPTLSAAHTRLGALHLIQKEFGAAKRDFQRALRLNPRDVTAHLQLGDLYYYRNKNFIAAKREYQRALRLKPGTASAEKNLKTIRQAAERAKKAERRFERELRKPFNHPAAGVEFFGKKSASQPAALKNSQNLFQFP
ncbi:MAG: tetratricopeptide repeat protein, partial [Nitrospinaceae bacterium]